MTKSLGQIAYEAYFAKAGGKSMFKGAPLPLWPAVTEQIKGGWEAAGQAVIVAFATEPKNETAKTPV